MKAVGIIAEYNPFHKGHEYHLAEAKKRSLADCTVVAMSGNFVQRGEPALMSKQLRTRMALSCGADLVIELPVWCATASAQGFATGGVALLSTLPGLTHLCFGTEADQISPLIELAQILGDESLLYKEAYLRYIKQGEQPGLARSHALKDLYPAQNYNLLLTPNNILALEYLIAMQKLHSEISPIAVTRLGQGYHDSGAENTSNNKEFASAEHIRNQLGAIIESPYNVPCFDSIKNFVPDSVYQFIENNPYPLFMNSCSQIIQYRLLQEDDFTKYLDVDEDLSNRIHNVIRQGEYFNASKLIEKLKTKECTYTHISRAVLHIVCGIKKDIIPAYNQAMRFPYLHILGMNAKGRAYLHEYKDKIKVPILTEYSNAKRILSPEAYALFELDNKASRIYQLLVKERYQIDLPDDYRNKIIIY